jgi:hypothetical protein
MPNEDMKGLFDFLNFVKRLQEIEKANLEIQQLKTTYPQMIAPAIQKESTDNKLLQILLDRSQKQDELAYKIQKESLELSRDMKQLTLQILILTYVMVLFGALQIFISVITYLKH